MVTVGSSGGKMAVAAVGNCMAGGTGGATGVTITPGPGAGCAAAAVGVPGTLTAMPPALACLPGHKVEAWGEASH